MYELRPYQQEAVQATLKHFRGCKDPAVVVLPTGAGKSLVIAELARLARGRVLVMAHVKELIEQNHAKYEGTSLGMKLSEWEEQRSKAKISYIMDTIEAAGSKSEAARRLGIKPTHLQYLLNEFKASKIGSGAGVR